MQYTIIWQCHVSYAVKREQNDRKFRHFKNEKPKERNKKTKASSFFLSLAFKASSKEQLGNRKSLQRIQNSIIMPKLGERKKLLCRFHKSLNFSRETDTELIGTQNIEK